MWPGHTATQAQTRSAPAPPSIAPGSVELRMLETPHSLTWPPIPPKRQHPSLGRSGPGSLGAPGQPWIGEKGGAEWDLGTLLSRICSTGITGVTHLGATRASAQPECPHPECHPTEDLLRLPVARGPDRPSCPPAFIHLNLQRNRSFESMITTRPALPGLVARELRPDRRLIHPDARQGYVVSPESP